MNDTTMQVYTVTLKFTDGVYVNTVTSYDEHSAASLALMASRMASTDRMYRGKLVEYSAVLQIPAAV